MQFKKIIPYNLKRLVPILGLAGATLFTACDKDDEPTRDIELTFYEYSGSNDYSQIDDMDQLKKYAKDPHIANIYMTVLDKNNYNHCYTVNLNAMRQYMERRINISPKIHGRGNFNFPVGVCDKADSLWFTQQGWTINKQLQR